MNQGWVAEQSTAEEMKDAWVVVAIVHLIRTEVSVQSEQTQEVILIKLLKSSKHRNIIQQMQKKWAKLLRPIRDQRGRRESKNRQRDRSRKPLRPCLNTVVQRSACNSGGFEHHLYGWGFRGSLVQSGWRVMAVRAGFQCRAAGWHSDEDNDVLVSHRITQQTHTQSQSRSGQAGPRGRAPNAPVGHKQSKGLAFSVPIVQWSSSTVQKGWNEAGSTHISNVQKGSIHVVKGAVASVKPHGL